MKKLWIVETDEELVQPEGRPTRKGTYRSVFATRAEAREAYRADKEFIGKTEFGMGWDVVRVRMFKAELTEVSSAGRE